jgi:hypothetical protein
VEVGERGRRRDRGFGSQLLLPRKIPPVRAKKCERRKQDRAEGIGERGEKEGANE